jgi:hypothetical protein
VHGIGRTRFLQLGGSNPFASQPTSAVSASFPGVGEPPTFRRVRLVCHESVACNFETFGPGPVVFGVHIRAPFVLCAGKIMGILLSSVAFAATLAGIATAGRKNNQKHSD